MPYSQSVLVCAPLRVEVKANSNKLVMACFETRHKVFPAREASSQDYSVCGYGFANNGSMHGTRYAIPAQLSLHTVGLSHPRQ